KPDLDQLRTYGRRDTPPRPWIGFLVYDMGTQLIVGGVYDGCPAEHAGLRVG
ncbi:MAG: signal protein PDZ, partial [Actinobacteria bacterium]|nr:signal protein PDZ [Actinomycetota bacterium]NIS33453.1 signal protein PDZ [Actinomycetota bacterium]NIW30167.1 signal protein PDZ [Actinomycetota bacterium]